MKLHQRNLYRAFLAYWPLVGVLVVLAASLALVNCSNTKTAITSSSGMGTVSVSISDPPSCAAPDGSFSHVFISIRSVQAHISSTASDSSSGWQELAPQLVSNPVQVDLLHLPANGACLLAQLGSTSNLPAGDYQQIRLLLVSNNPTGGPLPTPNACGSQGFNCVVLSDGPHELLLSSEAQTGLKIPPGQIVGGPIHVEAGKTVDLNVDFNACASILEQGNGEFRLKPALTAGVISTNTTGLSGKVVDSVTLQAIAGAQVALEQLDSGGIDRISMQALTDANGNFNFCPLPVGAVFDVVVDAIKGSVAYNATVALNVPGGTALGNIPLVAETGTATGPGTIQGFVTAVMGTSPTITGAKIDATLSSFQSVPVSGGSRKITIPLEKTASQNSTPLITVESASSCPAGSPAGAFCAQYTLVLPASNPSVGSFSAGSITYAAPAAGNVLYTVEARASQPISSGAAICSPSSMTTSLDSGGMPLKVTPGVTTTAQRLDFSGCS
jgi:hypothetical protein